PASAALQGSASDDGLPNPPRLLTTTWRQVSGPTPVSFGNAAATSTTATFPGPGTYVLSLTADDSALSATDPVPSVVSTQAASGTLDIRVPASADDAEESASGSMSLTSSDLELVHDSTDQKIGMRFNGVAIPPGSTIVAASIQFQVDETQPDTTSLV